MNKAVQGIFCGVLLAAGNAALAAHIDPPEDELVWWGTSGDSEAAEIQTLADFFGVSTDEVTDGYSKEDGWNGEGFHDNGDGTYSLDIGFEWSYLLVGFGNGTYFDGAIDGVDYDMVLGTHAIYTQSSDNLLTINLDDFYKITGNDVIRDIDILRVTHVSVPEPGTLVLLGSGLLGFGLSSMRRRKLRATA